MLEGADIVAGAAVIDIGRNITLATIGQQSVAVIPAFSAFGNDAAAGLTAGNGIVVWTADGATATAIDRID